MAVDVPSPRAGRAPTSRPALPPLAGLSLYAATTGVAAVGAAAAVASSPLAALGRTATFVVVATALVVVAGLAATTVLDHLDGRRRDRR